MSGTTRPATVATITLQGLEWHQRSALISDAIRRHVLGYTLRDRLWYDEHGDRVHYVPDYLAHLGDLTGMVHDWVRPFYRHRAASIELTSVSPTDIAKWSTSLACVTWGEWAAEHRSKSAAESVAVALLRAHGVEVVL